MFNIRFYNETGSVDFGGGRSQSPWKITDADGLSFCGRTFKYAKYAGSDGQKTTGVTVNSRTITLSGDVRLESGDDFEIKKAVTVLENEGTLEVNTGISKRKIDARCCDFYLGERKGEYLMFTVQFICDDPYFSDVDKTEVAIYSVQRLLNNSFTFQGMFSERISRRNVEYLGTKETEPVFYITVDKGDDGENLLIIHNHTTDESLRFNYGGVKGEAVTIDVKNCKIYNQDGENLLKYLADDSFFDGFHLTPGNNDIEVTNRNMNTGLVVKCCYANKYSEAVYI